MLQAQTAGFTLARAKLVHLTDLQVTFSSCRPPPGSVALDLRGPQSTPSGHLGIWAVCKLMCSILQAGMFLEDLRGAPDYPERVAELAAGLST